MDSAAIRAVLHYAGCGASAFCVLMESELAALVIVHMLSYAFIRLFCFIAASSFIGSIPCMPTGRAIWIGCG